MSAFYLTLLAVLLSGLGARDQVTVAGLSARQGRRPAVLVTACAMATASAAVSAWAGSLLIPEMQPAARVFLAAMALALAGIEAWIITPRPPKGEPTHSLGALALVLGVQQLADAARFIVFGIAVAAMAPVMAGTGGALAGAAGLVLGWAAPHIVLDPRMRLARRVIGTGFVAVGGYVALRALGRA